MASLFILLFTGRLMDVNSEPDSRERSTLEGLKERKLNAEYGVLNVTDRILLRVLGDVLVSTTNRSADTKYCITAVDLSPDMKTVYYVENAATMTNTSDSSNKTVAVWKAEWVEALQSYTSSHLAGGWPVPNKDPTKPLEDSDVSGLLVLDGGYLLVSQKHNDRIEKLEVTTGKSVDKWALDAPLGLAKHPAQDAFFASSGDRINKISLTVPSFWVRIDVVAGPETNISKTGYVDSDVSTEVRFSDPLIGPQSISLDSRNLYVLDFWSNVVRRVSITSRATKTIAGGMYTMFGLEGGFNRSSQCIVTGNGCNLFVTGRGRLHWLPLDDPDGNVLSIKIVAELVQSDGSSGSLMAMALTTDDRYLFVGTGDGRIMKLEMNVSALHQCGLPPLPPVDSRKKPTGTNMSRVMIFVGVALGCAIVLLGAGVCAMHAIRGFKHVGNSVIPPPDTKITESSTRSGTGTGISASLPSSFDPLRPTVVQEIPLSVIQMAIRNGVCLDGKSGAYGDVYRASLMVGQKMVDVAIKVMKGEFNEMKHKQFRAEVNTLSSVRHRHLCKLLGFCTEEKKFILVYPFIAGGSLFYDRLHKCKSTTGNVSEECETMDLIGSCNLPLTWTERMSIARQIATCLRYLHHEVDHPILHRDVKSRNVLVEGEGKVLRAYLADFGLARPGSCGHSDGTPSSGQTTVPTLTRSGTPGYMPPEYVYESKLTMSSDVFAFGVVLLELVTGMRAVMKMNEADSIPLYLLARQRELALRCTEDFPSQRPDMGQVVQEIDTIKRTNCASGGLKALSGHTFLHPLDGPSPR
ncbi:hypothetical protein CBR_g36422 [Chara braunii]|uniref:Protein kinase domain-containing protein n=1 Tax=Chara braunii TaxID=69332 RepID=A0A388LKZ2_CHABU|nr:hypothetical protein CBR_g36422 [Chara braunii]|eukprot:GBG82895.1 hypothetical protein CBR_g36422 [Chara braunii]